MHEAPYNVLLLRTALLSICLLVCTYTVIYMYADADIDSRDGRRRYGAHKT